MEKRTKEEVIKIWKESRAKKKAIMAELEQAMKKDYEQRTGKKASTFVAL